MSDTNEWNGFAIPPRPPLPTPEAEKQPALPPEQTPEPPVSVRPQAASASATAPPAPPAPPASVTPPAYSPSGSAESPVRRIGMPPGMEPALDTVPSSDHAAPVPVARPEFAPAPFVPAPSVPAPAAGTNAPVTAPAPIAAVTTNPRLVLPDATILSLAAGLIVGRDPQEQEGYGVTERATLHDVERSVSKTHAILGFSEGRVWVIDLNSTNGTVLIAADGIETLCTPEVATPVPAGSDIRFGEYRVRVVLD
ncbi:MAG: FHA domain-containing protein [Mycetocola sp.]